VSIITVHGPHTWGDDGRDMADDNVAMATIGLASSIANTVTGIGGTVTLDFSKPFNSQQLLLVLV